MLIHDRFIGRGAERRYRLGIIGIIGIIGGVSSGIVCGLDGPSPVA